jgi:multimeric flavodoxin WrbA
MTIIAFNGSPRKKGNTSTIIKAMLEGAESAGVETKEVRLQDLNMKGCCPIYMYRICGQMKILIDRMYSYYQYKPEGRGYDSAVPPGKTFALVVSQGASDPNQYQKSIRWLAGMAGSGLGFEEAGRIIHGNSREIPAQDDEKLLAEARAIGQKMAAKG